MPLVLNRTIDATVEPVTADELKVHLRWEYGNVEESLMESLIKGARRMIENLIGRALIDQTWVLKLDHFPGCIEVPRPPFSSLTGLQYVDQNGDTQAVTSSLYTVDSSAEPARIYEAYNKSWPTTYAIRNAVTVTYVAGYGSTAASVPEEFKIAIKLLAAHWFRNREASSPIQQHDIPNGVHALISPYTVQILGA